MLDRFASTFALTGGSPGSPIDGGSDLEILFARFGGCTFKHGLYRVHDPRSSAQASVWVAEAYPEYKFPIVSFGFDWLGNQFVLDPTKGTEPQVLLFEIGSGDALTIPIPFSKFHDYELVEEHVAALGGEMFAAWQSTHGVELAFDQCAGYKVPLFLNGEYDVSNLEVSDIEVYWRLTGQLRVATRHLAPGTPISGIGLDE